jgi:dipeptidyl aminopeptidase/acylaminoacyl peptidase
MLNKDHKIISRTIIFVACLLSGVTTVAQTAGGTSPQRVTRGALLIEGIPEIPADLQERLQQYENSRSASLADWLPSGEGMLITTRFADTSQIHRVDRPGGARSQLTFFDEPVRGASVSPAASVNGFLYLRDVGGSELYQIYFFDLATGNSTLMTDGISRNGSAVWSNRGDRFIFYSTGRNGKDLDLYIKAIGIDDEAVMVLSEGGAWSVYDWSPTDDRVIVERYVSRNEATIYVLNLATKALTPIIDSDARVSIGSALFSKDGAGVYYTSDEGSEFRTLRYRHLTSGAVHVVSGDILWDVEEFDLSDDGRYLAFTTNEDGVSRLNIRDLTTGKDVAVPAIPTGQAYRLSFAPRQHRIGIVLNSPKTPGDTFSLDIESAALTRWTYSETGGLDSDTFIEPELIRFPTFDKIDGEQRTIPAFYHKPKGSGPFPVLISIHGGPESQRRPSYSTTTQFLVDQLGIAVLGPNVRGSAGYGKSYLKLDNGRLREDSVKDIGALLDWIETQPELDSDRVAVFGGSYGGYMAAASLTHFGNRIRAGVDYVGISNFVTFLENTQDYRRELRRSEYGDESDPQMRAFLEEISPANNVHKISSAMFIAQGLNDPRVPASESEQMLKAIRDNGGDAWYLLATNEGHGFSKKANRDYFRAATVLFLQEYLVSEREPVGD